MLGAADMRRPVAAKYQHDLVVRVAVFRRASRRDLTDELRCYGAAESRAEQDAEPPVTGGLDLAIGEVPVLQGTGSLFHGRRLRGTGRRQRDHIQAQLGLLFGEDLEVRAGRNPCGPVWPELNARLPADV